MPLFRIFVVEDGFILRGNIVVSGRVPEQWNKSTNFPIQVGDELVLEEPRQEEKRCRVLEIDRLTLPLSTPHMESAAWRNIAVMLSGLSAPPVRNTVLYLSTTPTEAALRGLV